MHTVNQHDSHIAIKTHTNIDKCYLHIRLDKLHSLSFKKKIGGGIHCYKNTYLGETCPHLDMEIWYFFLNGWEIVKLGLDSDNYLT